jgi:hypothetical protein
MRSGRYLVKFQRNLQLLSSVTKIMKAAGSSEM